MKTVSNNKKAFVTGCCGFIGHHLVAALKWRGYYVVGVDDMSNGNPDYAELCDEFILGDIRTVEIPEGTNYVFHLAARAGVMDATNNPEETAQVNVNGTLRLLKKAADAGVEKFVYSSSSSVYGAQDTNIQSEEDHPRPLNTYGVQKYAAELFTTIFPEVYGLKTVSLRYFNVYGEDQNGKAPYATAVCRFLELNKNGQKLTIDGDGDQSRDMTYVGDVVNANILAAESPAIGIFNVGSGRRYTINEVAEYIAPGEERVWRPPRGNETRHSLADNSKIRSKLGWEPTTDIQTWIQKRAKNTQ